MFSETVSRLINLFFICGVIIGVFPLYSNGPVEVIVWHCNSTKVSHIIQKLLLLQMRHPNHIRHTLGKYIVNCTHDKEVRYRWQFHGHTLFGTLDWTPLMCNTASGPCGKYFTLGYLKHHIWLSGYFSGVVGWPFASRIWCRMAGGPLVGQDNLYYIFIPFFKICLLIQWLHFFSFVTFIAESVFCMCQTNVTLTLSQCTRAGPCVLECYSNATG